MSNVSSNPPEKSPLNPPVLLYASDESSDELLSVSEPSDEIPLFENESESPEITDESSSVPLCVSAFLPQPPPKYSISELLPT